MKGVIYARYSSDNQREESIEGQLRECKAFAEKNDIQIVETYIDRALSARTDRRPDFQRMIKDSSGKKFEVVIVWKLDRFARDKYDSAHYKRILKNNGVKVVSATEAISAGAEGILLESILEGMAEYYSAELSEKVTRGLTENALKCKYNGGTLPIGYMIDSEQYFQIDPLTAPAVLDAFKHYADGASMREITDEMNLKGVRTKRGGKISINSVTRMLHNRKYIGEYRYNDIVHPNGIPAIVPEDLFNRAQERMAANKKAPAKHKAEDEYLLTTKLFCGKCQCYMVGESGTGRNKVHRYYKCASVKNHKGCDKKTVKKEWIENLVIEQIKKLIFDDELIEKLADKAMALQGKENTTLPLLKKQYADTQKSIDNMLDAIQQGILTASTKERLESLEKQKSELSVQIIKEEMAKPTLSREQIIFWFHRFRKLNTKRLNHRRRLIDSFVNAIFLYDDRITFTFNYKDGTKTINFTELEKSGLGSDISALAAPYRVFIRYLTYEHSIFIYCDMVLCTEQALSLLLLLMPDTAFLLCRFRLGQVLHGNAPAGFGFDMPSVRHLRYFHIPDKTVVNDNPLGAIFPFALRFKYFNTVDEFTEQRSCQPVHPHKFTNCRSEAFTLTLSLSAFRKLLTECFYLRFQLHSLRLVFVR